MSIELNQTLWEDKLGVKIVIIREDQEIEMIQIGFTKFCTWTELVAGKKDSDLVCEASVTVEQAKSIIIMLQKQIAEIENRAAVLDIS